MLFPVALYQALEEAFSVHARCDSVHPTPLCLDTVRTEKDSDRGIYDDIYIDSEFDLLFFLPMCVRRRQ